MMNLRKTIVAASIAATLGFGISGVAFADNTTSTINGVLSVSGAKANEYTATAHDPKTGLTRNVEIGADGSFRFAKLPSGTYDITILKGDTVVAKDSVTVSLGKNAQAEFNIASNSGMEVLQVVGAKVNPVDLTTADSGLTINKDSIDLMPVGRDFTSISLLAPGAVGGDGRFGSGASFGGASVAENACYINGLEVTDTNQGLGCGSVPFEFYNEFQVKTGGYSAKFGRATGGMINTTTKSGTNEWEFSANVRYRPKSLQEEGKVSRSNQGTGTIFRDTRNDEFDSKELTLSVGGPLIKDKLFVYALVNPRDTSEKFSSYPGTAESNPVDRMVHRDSDGSDNLFWGGKVDWYITDNHSLSLFAYSNRNDSLQETYKYNPETETEGDYSGAVLRKRGGHAESITYNGAITEDLSVTAMVGQIKTQHTDTPDNLDCPPVAGNGHTGCGAATYYGDNEDKNKQYRLDVEYVLGDHLIKVGYDKQKRESYHTQDVVAGHYWTYSTLANGGEIQGDEGPLYTNNTGAPIDYVRDRQMFGGGGFTSNMTAYYVEDTWQILDSLRLNIGLRKDKFENLGVSGVKFTDLDTDIAPRLGFTWDVIGDGSSKVFGTYGRYYLPVPNNTNFRAAAGMTDFRYFYTYTGIDPTTGAPTGLQPLNPDNYIVHNSYPDAIPTTDTFQAKEADPFSRDEYILGYEQQISDNLVGTIRGTYRDVKSALDDYCGDLASVTCTLINPGKDMTWSRQEGDGTIAPEQTYTAEEIGLPKPKNTYKAVDLELKYNTDDLHMTFMYTWSKSEGNFEGAVKSDIGQADPGVTQDWDFPALMDGAEGYLPNDRRHVFKLYGTYNFTDSFNIGFNSVLSSGRPLSAFGKGYPDNDPHIWGSYGDTFYLYDPATDQYTRHDRGTIGRTPWTFRLDLSANYSFTLSNIDFVASVQAFNVLNIQETTSSNEHYESDVGVLNEYYGAAYDWQTPRYVEFSISARF